MSLLIVSAILISVASVWVRRGLVILQWARWFLGLVIMTLYLCRYARRPDMPECDNFSLWDSIVGQSGLVSRASRTWEWAGLVTVWLSWPTMLS